VGKEPVKHMIDTQPYPCNTPRHTVDNPGYNKYDCNINQFVERGLDDELFYIKHGLIIRKPPIGQWPI